MIKAIYFLQADGKAPLLDWIDDLPQKTRDKCFEKIERLREYGHLLRRPEADYLRDNIYELRIRAQRIQYRILYFFHGPAIVVLSYGIVKQQALVPPHEIEVAINRKQQHEKDPTRFTWLEG